MPCSWIRKPTSAPFMKIGRSNAGKWNAGIRIIFKVWIPMPFFHEKNLLNPDDPLIPIIESHTKRCAVPDLQEALSRIKEGIAAAQDEALDILFFDQHLREYLSRGTGNSPENQVFLTRAAGFRPYLIFRFSD